MNNQKFISSHSLSKKTHTALENIIILIITVRKKNQKLPTYPYITVLLSVTRLEFILFELPIIGTKKLYCSCIHILSAIKYEVFYSFNIFHSNVNLVHLILFQKQIISKHIIMGVHFLIFVFKDRSVEA